VTAAVGSDGPNPTDFRSYYGAPILNQPVWKSPDIPGYFFLGGLAGASSALAAGLQVRGRSGLARRLKIGAVAAVSAGAAALVHDLGRPARFANMLRVFKPTSPLSVGSWLLSAYGPAAGVAAVSDLTGTWRRTGVAATAAAAVLGPAVASYTAALVSDTAVPAWHEGYREMPFVFVGSAASAGGGLGLILASDDERGPAARLAVSGAALELGASRALRRRLGPIGEPYERGRAGRYMRAAEVLTGAGLLGATFARRRRAVAAAAGGALLAGSACTRWAVYHAGMASANDPRYVVVPQRARRDARSRAR
jgi:DMSO reductase anchor subunit